MYYTEYSSHMASFPKLNFTGKDFESQYLNRIQQSMYPGNSDSVISMQLSCIILDI